MSCEYGLEDGIVVKCKKPEGEYPVPEFLSAIDSVYCNYLAWATLDDEHKFSDALAIYARHKKEDYWE